MPNSSDIKDYHAHIYYDPVRSRDRAEHLRKRVAEVFPSAKLGRWHDELVGPHPQSMYQIAFPTEMLAAFVLWLVFALLLWLWLAASPAAAVDPPMATISSPADNQTFSLNEVVSTSFSCSEATGGLDESALRELEAAQHTLAIAGRLLIPFDVHRHGRLPVLLLAGSDSDRHVDVGVLRTADPDLAVIVEWSHPEIHEVLEPVAFPAQSHSFGDFPAKCLHFSHGLSLRLEEFAPIAVLVLATSILLKEVIRGCGLFEETV